MMDFLFESTIKDILERVQKNLTEKFQDNMIGLVLYGSWAKGTAQEDSDIDLWLCLSEDKPLPSGLYGKPNHCLTGLLVVLNSVDTKTREVLYEIERDIAEIRDITLMPATVEEFQKEKNPLYTAIKKDGKIIMGAVDFSLNPEPPQIKYADYFEKSKEFESRKVEMTEDILKEHSSYGSVDLCFVASKHAVQMALAMKGVGYSSKVAALLPLAKEQLGEDAASKFKRLFELYTKSEYNIESLCEEEMRLAVKYAKEILAVCYK